MPFHLRFFVSNLQAIARESFHYLIRLPGSIGAFGYMDLSLR